MEGCLLIFPLMLPGGPGNENGAFSFLFITYGDGSDVVDGDSDSHKYL